MSLVAASCVTSAAPSFPLLPGAKDVRVFPERGNGEWFFSLARPYPAQDVIDSYDRHAATHGWTSCAVPEAGWHSILVADRTEFRLARVWADMPGHQAALLFVRYREPGNYRGKIPRSATLYVNFLLVPVAESKDPCDEPPAQGRIGTGGGP